jgi:hypothetical protein
VLAGHLAQHPHSADWLHLYSLGIHAKPGQGPVHLLVLLACDTEPVLLAPGPYTCIDRWHDLKLSALRTYDTLFIRGALSADSSTRRHFRVATRLLNELRVQHDIVRIDNVARIFCAIARCQLIVATSGRKSSVQQTSSVNGCAMPLYAQPVIA